MDDKNLKTPRELPRGSKLSEPARSGKLEKLVIALLIAVLVIVLVMP